MQKLVSYFLFEDTVDNKTTARLESIGTMQTNKLEMIATPIMAIRVVEFSSGGTNLEIFLHKNQHTQRKLLNFEFWFNGELSKIGHHLSNKMI